MDQARRDLLKASAAWAALIALPRPLGAGPLMAHVRGVPEPVPPITDPDVKELALRAVDAAKRAGASYADVRLTYSKRRMFDSMVLDVNFATDAEELHVGVRALVDGYWGFASGMLWAKDEMDRLGRQAVALAKANSGGKGRPVELAAVPVVHDGHWATPMTIDPFEVSPFEVVDYMQSLADFTAGMKIKDGWVFGLTQNYEARSQERAFASSEGSYCTQRLQRGFPLMMVGLQRALNPITGAGGETAVEFIDHIPGVTSFGFEIFKGQPIRDYILEVMDSMLAEQLLPMAAVEVGRYDAVCDARTVASLLHSTLATATQLDRAFGYEANASGTSYLADPLGMLGTYQAGSPQLTLIADRSSPGGAASVKWDDEGVAPEDFLVVKDGVLVNFPTTRESAMWLKERSATRPTSGRSTGCADSTNAMTSPTQAAPNLKLVPTNEGPDMAGLMANLSNGLVIRGMMPPNRMVLENGKTMINIGNLDMDYQALNGFTRSVGNLPGRIGRVKNGKQVARTGGVISFRSPELWQGLAAVGGEAAVRSYGMRDSKDEPSQDIYHTVTTPPAVFKQLTLRRD